VDHTWTMSVTYDYERYQNDPNLSSLDSVDTQKLNSELVNMRWFASAQWTVNLNWSHNEVTSTQQLSTGPLVASSPYSDNFDQLDADTSWQFTKAGLLTVGVRNAANTAFQYTEIDPLNPRFSKGRMLYAQVKLGW